MSEIKGFVNERYNIISNSEEEVKANVGKLFCRIDDTPNWNSLQCCLNEKDTKAADVSDLFSCLNDTLFVIRGCNTGDKIALYRIFEHIEIGWYYLSSTSQEKAAQKIIEERGKWVVPFCENIDCYVGIKKGNTIFRVNADKVKLLDKWFCDIRTGMIFNKGSAEIDFDESDHMHCISSISNRFIIYNANNKVLGEVTNVGTIVYKDTPRSSYPKIRFMCKVSSDRISGVQFVNSRVLYCVSRNLNYSDFSMKNTEIDHIDGNSLNNSIGNLQCVSPELNKKLRNYR